MKQPQIPVQILAYYSSTDAYWVRIPCFHFADAWESLASLALLDCISNHPRIDEPCMDTLAEQMEIQSEIYLSIVAEDRITLAEPQIPGDYVQIPAEFFSGFSEAIKAIDQRAKIHRGKQLVEHPLLDLSLEGHGWMRFHLRLGPHELKANISYLSQPLEHLLLLALSLEHGVNQFQWSWDQEGTYIHGCVDTTRCPYSEITFSKGMERQPDITDQELFCVSVDWKELSTQIHAAAADLLQKQGLGGYRNNWGYPFPNDLFVALSRRLR